MHYRDCVKEIEARGIMPDTAPSLEPMKKALARILKPEQIFPDRVIVVAGTNGKGSVCATLEALLLHAGQRVGLYTSPHLRETTERIRIQGVDLTQDEFVLAYEAVVQATQGIRLSHFEVLTLMAAWSFFSKNPVEWAIFEVGLGGTWDATNAIPHTYSIITTLGYDHQNLLGSTIEEIASNKFGIVTQAGQVIHSPLPPETLALAKKIQNQTDSKWRECAPFDWTVEPSSDGPIFFLQTAWGKNRLNIPGKRAALNSATALTAFEALGFSPSEHLTALSQVRWPGRMEKISYSASPCPIYLSGDHNPQGVQSLLELLEFYPRRHLHILVGVGKDKDAEGILKPLFELPHTSITLTETPFRGRSVSTYGEWLKQAQGAYSDAGEAFQHVLKQAQSGDMILITGSLYLVGYFADYFSSPNPELV